MPPSKLIIAPVRPAKAPKTVLEPLPTTLFEALPIEAHSAYLDLFSALPPAQQRPLNDLLSTVLTTLAEAETFKAGFTAQAYTSPRYRGLEGPRRRAQVFKVEVLAPPAALKAFPASLAGWDALVEFTAMDETYLRVSFANSDHPNVFTRWISPPSGPHQRIQVRITKQGEPDARVYKKTKRDRN